MNPLPDEDPVEIEARAILADFNDKLNRYFTDRIKQHLIVSEVSVVDANYVWIPETLHILGTALGWELVKKLCLFWQDKLDLLFDRMLNATGKFSPYYGTMGWTGNIRENEEIIADILDFSKFGIETGFLREEVQKRTEILLQKFTP